MIFGRPCLPLHLTFICVGLIFFGLITVDRLSGQEIINPPSRVDFTTSIYPILSKRCFECHSGEQADGDLRLDNAEDVEFGGHTGNRILGNQPDESELFRRVTSSEDGFRMPKEGDPLSDSEIATIKRWIEQGAPWENSTTSPISSDDNAASPSITQRLANGWIWANAALKLPRYQYAAIATLPLFAFMVFAFLSRRRRKTNHLAVRSGSAGRPLAILVSLVLTIVVSYQYGLVKELSLTQSKLESKLPKYTIKKRPVVDPSQFTLPPYPMHPKRLGGIYYRGNDERSPKLFNGGFYRTATLEVWLVDSDGKRFAWNDTLPDRMLFIQLTIERAPGTTPTLFGSSVMNTAYLRHFPQTEVPESTRGNSDEFSVDPTDTEGLWETKIPIGRPSEWNSQFAEGMIYLYYGSMIIDGHRGRIHLGIKYNIQPKDNKISTDSEIWMGSLYNLNGRVFVPTKKIILLDRWFDFRPIPEIQGTHTSDPELLGIPEHIKQ